ncbi:MAG: DUF4234 domain-containing protein [Nanobdellota archaeon]
MDEVIEYFRENKDNYDRVALRNALIDAGYRREDILKAEKTAYGEDVAENPPKFPDPPEAKNNKNTEKPKADIKKRNILLVYVLTFITLFIYGIVWSVKTKNEINKLGGNIPTAWLIIIPIANLFWLYKYAESFSKKVKGDNNNVLWFLLFALIGIVTPAIVQSELNKHAKQD